MHGLSATSRYFLKVGGSSAPLGAYYLTAILATARINSTNLDQVDPDSGSGQLLAVLNAANVSWLAALRYRFEPASLSQARDHVSAQIRKGSCWPRAGADSPT
jgi:hypothetical protein